MDLSYFPQAKESALKEAKQNLNEKLNMERSKKRIVVAILIGMVIFSCKRKDEVFTSDPNARLAFSVSEVHYDTLYSGLRYPTKRIKVYNTNSQALAIDQVMLSGGVSSFYKIVVNGQAGPVVSGLELLGGDSMVIFVDLSFPVQNKANPYNINDAIRFVFNGQEQVLSLKAVGEDALLVEPGNLTCAETWDDQKAVILLGETVVPAGCVLTINKGAKVLSAVGASLNVKGTLVVAGVKNEPVYIGSVAVGKNPGQWKGIRFYEGSSANNLSWLYLANAESGLSFASPSAASLVDIALDHAALYDFTLYAIDLSHTNLTASNCLFIASAKGLTRFSKEGTYDFIHCTWQADSYDYYREGSGIQTSDITGSLSLKINQSIVWGDKTNELDLASATNASINNSILRTDAIISGVGQLLNLNPQFVTVANRNYQLQASSPAIDKGTPSSITDDLKGETRDALPDFGCYEFIP